MAALVNYISSEGEEELENTNTSLSSSHRPEKSKAQPSLLSIDLQRERRSSTSQAPSLSEKPLGPTLGPDIAVEGGSRILRRPMMGPDLEPPSLDSSRRLILQELTLPTIPNYDIPPSPPGAPVEGIDSKFKHFLGLKKGGVHFNGKLSRSSALKNPSLMKKLMDFSEIDEASQYAVVLPKHLWDPNAFPEYAYKEALSKSQQKITKQRERRKDTPNESVDFVSASGEAGNGNSNVIQKSTAEKVMAGLDRGTSSQIIGVKRKTRFEN